jgi:hypothetical protein
MKWTWYGLLVAFGGWYVSPEFFNAGLVHGLLTIGVLVGLFLWPYSSWSASSRSLLDRRKWADFLR